MAEPSELVLDRSELSRGVLTTFLLSVGLLTLNDVGAVPNLLSVQSALTAIGVAGVGACLVAWDRRTGRSGFPFRRPWVFVPLAAMLWILFSWTLNGFAVRISFGFWVPLCQLGLFLAATRLMGAGTASPRRAVLVYVWTLGAVVFFEAGFGVWQYLAIQWRVWGTTNNMNHFAGFLAAGFPVLAGLAAGAFGLKRLRAAAWVGLPLAIASVVFSGSRGALVALVGGLLLTLTLAAFARRRVVWGVLGAILLTAALVQVVRLAATFRDYYFRYGIGIEAGQRLPPMLVSQAPPPPAAQRFYDFNGDGRLDALDLVLAAEMRRTTPAEVLNARHIPTTKGFLALQFHRFKNLLTIPDETSSIRYLAVTAAAELFWEYPVAGVGLGNYTRHVLDRLPRPDPAILRHHSHCLPANLAAELGLPGLILWGWVLGGLAVVFWRDTRRPGRLSRNPAFWLGMALLVLVFVNLLDVTILYRPIRWHFPLLAAAFLSAVAGRRESLPENRQPPQQIC